METIIRRLHEARLKESESTTEYDVTKIYEIKCRDDEGTLGKILEAIKGLGDTGHSTNIVIDAGDSEREQRFFYDGDGPDRIYEINSK